MAIFDFSIAVMNPLNGYYTHPPSFHSTFKQSLKQLLQLAYFVLYPFSKFPLEPRCHISLLHLYLNHGRDPPPFFGPVLIFFFKIDRIKILL